MFVSKSIFIFDILKIKTLLKYVYTMYIDYKSFSSHISSFLSNADELLIPTYPNYNSENNTKNRIFLWGKKGKNNEFLFEKNVKRTQIDGYFLNLYVVFKVNGTLVGYEFHCPSGINKCYDDADIQTSLTRAIPLYPNDLSFRR